MSDKHEIVNDPKEIFEAWYNDQLADDENQKHTYSEVEEKEGEK